VELHAPKLWPDYGPGYYAAFVRDPDGNNVEAEFSREVFVDGEWKLPDDIKAE